MAYDRGARIALMVCTIDLNQSTSTSGGIWTIYKLHRKSPSDLHIMLSSASTIGAFFFRTPASEFNAQTTSSPRHSSCLITGRFVYLTDAKACFNSLLAVSEPPLPSSRHQHLTSARYQEYGNVMKGRLHRMTIMKALGRDMQSTLLHSIRRSVLPTHC